MNAGQRFLKWILPRSLFDAWRRGTRSFILACPCGHKRDLWDAGGAKGAGNKQRTLARCPACNKVRWHEKRKKTAEELELFPIEPHPDGSLEFGPRRDRWATALVWGTALLFWVSGIVVALLSEDPTEAIIAFHLAALGGFIAPWFWATTSYHLSNSELRLQSGCFSTTLQLTNIRRVHPVRGGVGISYSFSLDTLCINMLGKRLGYRIAPKDRELFLTELAKRCPQLRRVGNGLRAGS